MVRVSPSVLEVEGREGISPPSPAVVNIVETVFAALIAAASVESCDGFRCQFLLACKPSRGVSFGSDEDGRWSILSPTGSGGTTLADL